VNVQLLVYFLWRCSNGFMKHPPPTQAFGPVVNRFSDVMMHSDRFAFRGVSRLAEDAGVSPSSVSRLINNKLNPSFAFVARLTAAVEKQLGYRIDPRDLIAESGNFLTALNCVLVGCRGCLPEEAKDEFGSTTPAFAGVRPGTWVTSRYPNGFDPEKGTK